MAKSVPDEADLVRRSRQGDAAAFRALVAANAEPLWRCARLVALPLAVAIAASLLIGAWWMTDRQATPPPAQRPPLIRHAIHELARAETDADFDEAMRRRYGSAAFGASTSQSRPRDLMKEFLQ